MATAIERAAPLLARQHALITGRQATDVGIHPQTLARLVQRGIWERVDVSLYGPVGVPMSWRRSLMASVLLAPPGSVVSHRAAATLQGVGGLVDPIPEISIPSGSSLRRTGMIVHESTDLHLADTRCIDGIPVTGPRRLAVDLGGVVSPARFRQTIREIRFILGVTTDDLLRTYLRHARQGRTGCGALRDWLDRYFHLEGVPESGFEQNVLDAILDAGLPAPEVQHWVKTDAGPFRLDLAYPEPKLDVEVDGIQHEDDPEVVAADAARTAALERLGWTVERIRKRTFASDLERTLRRIRSAVTHSHQM